MKTSGTFRGSGSQGALGSVETGLFSGGIPFDFVAQERECEGARPVDDLSPVGAALFEQGHGTVRPATAIQTVPTGFCSVPPAGPAMPVVATA